MSKKNKLIPELRFPEFAKSAEWEEKTVDETCAILNNQRKPLSSDEREKGEFPYYGASGIIDYVKEYIFNERLLLVGEDGAKWGAYENTAFMADGKYWVNNHAHVLKPKTVLDTFLENYLVKLDLIPFITGAAPPKLTLGKLKSISFPVPKDKKEQQKIASCLSSLESLIKAHGQKLDLLKDHKKGLMQSLFPQKGEKVPKLRFKEFEGEWAEKPLASLSFKISDGIHATPVYDDDGEYYFINGNNLVDGKILIDEKTKRVSLSEYEKHKRDLNENTILLSINGTIGNISVYNNEKVVLGKSACYININENKSNKEYIIHFLQSEKVKQFFNSELTGSTIKNLSLKSIKEAIVNLPSKPEQQKIASCLSTLNELIIEQAEKIERLKQHKKGLMQGLFPKIEI